MVEALNSIVVVNDFFKNKLVIYYKSMTYHLDLRAAISEHVADVDIIQQKELSMHYTQ